MTGDIKIELTITAEAVQALFSLLNLKESVNLVDTTTASTKESNKESIKNSVNNTHYDVDVVANKLSIGKANRVEEESVYPPTKEEIEEYARKKGYKIATKDEEGFNPNRFYLYYSRLGWCSKNGVSIVKTWRETIDYWMTNNVSNSAQAVDKTKREELKATHPFTPTEF